ncbi:VirK family protein [Rhizobium tumorigenes]|uniref:VirK family protein n=1 Tax=Rhizobium tumorigenes TaxID=2041385 RepID=A0AAF1KV23_9HYPH|nr:VirK family protein [Rhizobium tumorigenes]WFR96206.1 VirK family protein [Rhizobium tumorigenes]
MKRFLAVLLLACQPLAASAAPSSGHSMSLQSVENALVKGRSVAVSLDLGRCTSGNGDEKPSKTRGGLKIEAFRIMDDGTLAFADEHMTLDLEGKPIVQLLRYRVHPDKNAEFTMTVFSLPAYTQVGTPRSFTCKIDDGISFFTAR